MYPFEETQMENKQAKFDQVSSFFKEQGFDVGGNWEYDHGYFDRKLEGEPGYLFLRIPVLVEEGSFGEDDALVRIGTPFALHHKYQRGNDDQISVDVISASLNQFSEPQDADASLKEESVQQCRELLERVDQAFAARFLK